MYKRQVTSIGRYLRSQGYEALIKDSDHSPKLELENINRLFTQKMCIRDRYASWVQNVVRQFGPYPARA